METKEVLFKLLPRSSFRMMSSSRPSAGGVSNTPPSIRVLVKTSMLKGGWHLLPLTPCDDAKPCSLCQKPLMTHVYACQHCDLRVCLDCRVTEAPDSDVFVIGMDRGRSLPSCPRPK